MLYGWGEGFYAMFRCRLRHCGTLGRLREETSGAELEVGVRAIQALSGQVRHRDIVYITRGIAGTAMIDHTLNTRSHIHDIQMIYVQRKQLRFVPSPITGCSVRSRSPWSLVSDRQVGTSTLSNLEFRTRLPQR